MLDSCVRASRRLRVKVIAETYLRFPNSSLSQVDQTFDWSKGAYVLVACRMSTLYTEPGSLWYLSTRGKMHLLRT